MNDDTVCIAVPGFVWVCKQGGLLDWTRGSSPHGALKTRRCSKLDLWVVPAWSLKNKDVFRIRLVDHARMEP